MNRRAFIQRLTAGVMAAYLLRDALVWNAPEVESDAIPIEAVEAIKALGDAVDDYILSKYTGFYAGTVPFASWTPHA